ncbi:MAG: hypothetical protein JSS20_20540 [Proteobacteria bacterium]|nr:hypothetical protein [Pseudomonadota bacterium]
MMRTTDVEQVTSMDGELIGYIMPSRDDESVMIALDTSYAVIGSASSKSGAIHIVAQHAGTTAAPWKPSWRRRY